MRNLLDALYRISGWLAAGFIGAIGLLVVVQVSCNLIDRISTIATGTAIGLTIPSYADFTGFFLASASFLALAHTFRQGGHIRVTLFISHLPPLLAKAAEFWCIGVAALISCYFTWYTGILVWESYDFHDLSSGMIAIPLWIPQLGMLIGLAILSIALLDEFIGLIRGIKPSYHGKGENLLATDDDTGLIDAAASEDSRA
jgi:TRAP-type C4-dicarboxylate transport system permease small subunit